MTVRGFEPSVAPRFEDVFPIADAVMYEGYVLYPYRASSIKNRVRWNFGGVYPRTYSAAQTGVDECEVGTECLVRGRDSSIAIDARFLELSRLASNGELEEAEPRAFHCELGRVSALVGQGVEHAFTRGRLFASLAANASALGDDVFRVRLSLRNDSNSPAIERKAALADTLMAAHLILRVQEGAFVSLLDPPPELAEAARRCAQRGLWPVLVGSPDRANQLLASPIILYDYPRIAPESRADSCDATEIDEILLLRVLTLSDAEKLELRSGDARARAILERAEALSADELLRLHGRLQTEPGTPRVLGFAIGQRVRLRPKARADIFDLALAGRIATVRAVERDFEDRVHLSVTVDDDPGADLGALGLPGHRFFFFADEVEPLGTADGGAS